MDLQNLDRIFIDWHSFLGEQQFPSAKQHLSVVSEDFRRYLEPVGRSYVSDLNPTFLAECMSIRELQKSSIWMARDGSIPLRFFFNRFPDPEEFRGTLLIQRDLCGLVPKSWHPRVRPYFLARQETSSASKCDQLLILGLNSPSYCSLSQAHDQLVEVLKQAKGLQVTVLLINKSEPLQAVEVLSAHANKLIELIVSNFKQKVQFISLNEFFSNSSFAGWKIYDLNDCSICVDNYLIHHALVRGAQILNDEPQLPGREISAVSMNYSICKLNLGEIDGSVQAPNLNSAAMNNFPWFYWYRNAKKFIVYWNPLLERIYKVSNSDFASFTRKSPEMGFVDSMSFDDQNLHIVGWALDKKRGQIAESFILCQGEVIRSITVERVIRKDVLSDELGEKPLQWNGFHISVPLEGIKANNPLSLIGIFPDGSALHIIDFKIDEKTKTVVDRQDKSKKENTTYSKLEKQLKIGERITYEIVNPLGRYLGDTTEINTLGSSDRKVVGWAFDTQARQPAVAIVIGFADGSALTLACQKQREDLIFGVGEDAEWCGFDEAIAKGPRVKEAFAVFESGEAIEIGISVK